MQMNLTKLATALILGSTLVGCAAVIKTPYQAPAVQVPNSFAYDNARSKQNQSSKFKQIYMQTNGGHCLAIANSINWLIKSFNAMLTWL